MMNTMETKSRIPTETLMTRTMMSVVTVCFVVATATTTAIAAPLPPLLSLLPLPSKVVCLLGLPQALFQDLRLQPVTVKISVNCLASER